MAFGTSLWLPAVIAGGTSLLSGLFGSKGAKNAAKQQQAAAQEAMAFERAQYEQARADLEPWRRLGAPTISTLGDLMSRSLAAGQGNATLPWSGGNVRGTGPRPTGPALATLQGFSQGTLQAMDPRSAVRPGEYVQPPPGAMTIHDPRLAAGTSPAIDTWRAQQGLPYGRQPSGPTLANPGGAPRIVTVQAPSGATRQMPIEQAQQYLDRGGRIVG